MSKAPSAPKAKSAAKTKPTVEQRLSVLERIARKYHHADIEQCTAENETGAADEGTDVSGNPA